MASFLNKAKAKVEEIADRNQNKGDNPHSSNAGPHSSNVVNKADPTIDSDRDHRNDPTSRAGGYGNTQTADQYGTAHGPGGVTSSDTYGSSANHPGYDNPRSGNAGPHSSNLVNKADPRFDSDYDGRNDPTSRVGGVGNTQQHGDNYSRAGGPGGMATSDTGYGTHTGPTGHTGQTGYAGHTGSTGYTGDAGYTGGAAQTGYSGDAGYTGGAGHTGHTGYTGDTSRTGGLSGAAATGTGIGGAGTSYGADTGNTYDNPRSTNAGPHNSNLMNKLDPRHDSDRDHRNDPISRVGGYGAQGDDYGRTSIHEATTHPAGSGYGAGHTGTHGVGHNTGNTGYGDNSGFYGAGHNTGNTGYGDNSYTPGSGTASNTAGPHNSNLLNKIDPRVDSDLDGSKTYGGNQTHR